MLKTIRKSLLYKVNATVSTYYGRPLAIIICITLTQSALLAWIHNRSSATDVNWYIMCHWCAPVPSLSHSHPVSPVDLVHSGTALSPTGVSWYPACLTHPVSLLIGSITGLHCATGFNWYPACLTLTQSARVDWVHGEPALCPTDVI